MKAFRDAPLTTWRRRQMGEALVLKYPQSRYRVEVYGWLVKATWGQVMLTRWK